MEVTTEAEREILQLEEDNRRAESASDLPGLGRSWADGFFLTNPAGKVLERDFIVAHIPAEAPKPEIRRYEKESMRVKVYGDAAIASYRVVVDGRYDGKDFAHQFQVTDVWVRLDGRWRLATTHTAQVLEAPQC